MCPRERRAKWLGSVGQSMRAESEVQVQAPASLGKADGRAGGEAGNLGPTVGPSPRSEPSPGALGTAEQQGSVAWAMGRRHGDEPRTQRTHKLWPEPPQRTGLQPHHLHEQTPAGLCSQQSVWLLALAVPCSAARSFSVQQRTGQAARCGPPRQAPLLSSPLSPVHTSAGSRAAPPSPPRSARLAAGR